MALSADQLRDLHALGIEGKLLLDIVTIFERDQAGGGNYLEKDRKRSQRYRDRRRANGMGTAFRGDRFRADLMKRDGGVCIFCGKEPGTDFDHFLPVSQGGTDDLDNLGLACRPCNSGKGGRTPDEARMNFYALSAEKAFNRYLAARNRADGARLNHEAGADEVADESAAALILSNLPSCSAEPLKEGSKKVKSVVVEGPERPKRKVSLPLPDDWQPNAAHHAKATELKLAAGCLEGKCEDMRNWAASNDIRKADWNATFHGFLRRAAETNGGSNGKRSTNSGRKSSGADFFAGLTEVAKDIVGDGAVARNGAEEIPRGRLEIDG